MLVLRRRAYNVSIKEYGMKVKIVESCQGCTKGKLYQVYNIKYNQTHEYYTYKIRNDYGNLIWVFEPTARRLNWD